MATIKLTDAKIKTLKPQDKVYRILDADRLYIEVRPTGVKVWRFKFVFNGKESSMSLGEYPIIGLADARLLREEMRAKLAKDIHPVEDRKKLKQVEDEKFTNTFSAIAQEYAKERLKTKSERYAEQFQVSLEKDILPIIGNKDVRNITSADVLTIIKNTMKNLLFE